MPREIVYLLYTNQGNQMTAEELELLHEKESLAEAISRTSEMVASWKDLPNYGPGANIRNEAIKQYERTLTALKARYAALPKINFK